MKIRNGAVRPRTAKEAGVILKDWQKRTGEEINRRQQTTKKLIVEIDAFNWGLLNAGALVNGCTPEEALTAFINCGEGLNDWWNEGCPMDGDFVVPDPRLTMTRKGGKP